MIYQYYGINGCESSCDIKIYGNTVIAYEIDSNTGTTITNFAEIIATEILRRYNIFYKDLIWIECYRYKGVPDYSLVKFEYNNGKLTRPKWYALNDDEIGKSFKNYFCLNYSEYDGIDEDKLLSICDLHNAFLEPRSKRIFFKPTVINGENIGDGVVRTFFHDINEFLNNY